MYGNRVRRVPKVAEIVSGIHVYHKNIVNIVAFVTLSPSITHRRQLHLHLHHQLPPSTNPRPASRIFDFVQILLTRTLPIIHRSNWAVVTSA
jgi:hypothetical protein